MAVGTHLCPIAAHNASEVVGQSHHIDPNQSFTLIPYEPASPELSHRDRDVGAAHASELGQFVLTHADRDRVPATDGTLAAARGGQTQQQTAEPLLRDAPSPRFDARRL